MALLFMDGFDVGDFATKWVAIGTTSNTTTRFGTGRSVLTQNVNDNISRSFTAANEVFFGAALMYGNTTFRDPLNSSSYAVTFYGDNGVTQHIGVATDSLGRWAAYLGATQIALSAPVLLANVWFRIEVRVLIADSGGRCVVKIDGTTIIDFTGDTKNGGTATSVDKVKLCGISNFSTNQYWDDVSLCDASGAAPYNTYLGDCRVLTVLPTAAGSSTQLTPDTGSNYARVNEVPYSSANYVSGSTPALRDTYTMSDIPANVATVYGVQHNVVAKRTSTGAIAVKPAIKSGASVYYGATIPVTTNDTTYSDLRITDPNTAAAWTVSGVNNLESGLEIA